MSEQTYKNAPVEVLREFYRNELELYSFKEVAERTGLGKTTLQSFMAGSNPHPRTRRTLALYYALIREFGAREDALELLSGGEEELKTVVLTALLNHHQQHGREVPQWLDALSRPARASVPAIDRWSRYRPRRIGWGPEEPYGPWDTAQADET